jgi:sulfoxide reductase heme-binding subunit YedZ
MLAKPLALLFKGLFVKILPLRHWLGVILSIAVFIHVFVFASNLNYNFGFLIDPKFWNFKKLIGWGLLAFVLMIPLFITSNRFSIVLLKKKWKLIQRLAYFFFVAAGIHIYLATGRWYYTILPIASWAILYIIALIRRNRSMNRQKQ